MGWCGWPKYVSVAERRKKARKTIAKLTKKGAKFNPVTINGKTIANTFWGKSWCKNLESYSDFANRLPRGRTYVRNGSVVDLNIKPGKISAIVFGSDMYNIEIEIAALSKQQWSTIIKECSGKIDSLLELLQGKFSKSVMEIITRPRSGLFPHPKEIKLSCSCPDYANMCKHVAAVLYGIGARLDQEPTALFELRKVDHTDLITAASTDNILQSNITDEQSFSDTELATLFNIDIENTKPKTKKSKKSAKNKCNSPAVGRFPFE